MRWTCVPLIVALAACGYSQEDLRNAQRQGEINAQDVSNRAAAAAEAEFQDCERQRTQAIADRDRAIEGNERLIKATLDEVTAQETTAEAQAVWGFVVNIETLRPPEWQWTEEEAGAGANNMGVEVARSDRMRYTVDPTKLVGTVQVSTYMNRPAVLFSCAIENCIRVVGSTIMHLSDGSQRARPVDERRSRNFWAVRTQNRAEALAATMSELLGRINAPQPAACLRRQVR